jgi:hypothetical protein
VTEAHGAARFLGLANHAIGDHLGERARARALCEQVLEQLAPEPGEGAWLQAAVARHLDGDEDAAQAARACLPPEAAQDVRIGMLLAQARMHEGDWERAASLYEEGLRAAAALPEGHAAERAIAITSNNLATELLEQSGRSPAQKALMASAAQAARTYWLRIGTWVNAERADYLLASVHAALGHAQEARTYAERGLETIRSGDEEQPVDEAFLHLARATACRDLGALQEQEASLARADELARGFDEAWLTSWFETERTKAQ